MVAVSREEVAQQLPAENQDWRTFPASTLRAGTLLYRAARRGRSPWWFCSDGDCRFDLTGERGTCYLGTDAVSGVLETIGPEWLSGRTLSPGFVRLRVLHTWRLAEPKRMANLVSRRAVGFRVTNELSSMTPYDVPQAFAQLFDGLRRSGRPVFEGIRFRTRFDTDPHARGVALFGAAGNAEDPRSDAREIDDDLLDELRDLGMVIEELPALWELDLAP